MAWHSLHNREPEKTSIDTCTDPLCVEMKLLRRGKTMRDEYEALRQAEALGSLRGAVANLFERGGPDGAPLPVACRKTGPWQQPGTVAVNIEALRHVWRSARLESDCTNKQTNGGKVNERTANHLCFERNIQDDV